MTRLPYGSGHGVGFGDIQNFVMADQNSGCWLWLYADNGHGYGVVRRGENMQGVHVISYEQHVGPVPDGLYVLHKCDTPICVNPHHLFLGTLANNSADKVRKGRQSKGRECSNKGALTEQDIAEIFAASGPQHSIAKRFGISQSMVSMIKSAARWKHLGLKKENSLEQPI